MAYMNQENKKLLAPKIKAVLKKYGMKGSISIRHHSTLVVTLKQGKIDFADKYVNEYHLDSHHSGIALEFLTELKDAMNNCEQIQNFDKSNSQEDYFHVGWYIDINIGKWDQEYKIAA